MIFLEAWYSPLLLAHLLATFLLVGIMTHYLLCVSGYLRGRFGREALELRYLRVTWWTYLAGAAATAGAWLALRWLPQRRLSGRAARSIGLAAAAAVLFAMGVMLRHEFLAWGIWR